MANHIDHIECFICGRRQSIDDPPGQRQGVTIAEACEVGWVKREDGWLCPLDGATTSKRKSIPTSR